MSSLSYARHRFPSVIIQHAVWLYVRFALMAGARAQAQAVRALK